MYSIIYQTNLLICALCRFMNYTTNKGNIMYFFFICCKDIFNINIFEEVIRAEY